MPTMSCGVGPRPNASLLFRGASTLALLFRTTPTRVFQRQDPTGTVYLILGKNFLEHKSANRAKEFHPNEKGGKQDSRPKNSQKNRYSKLDTRHIYALITYSLLAIESDAKIDR
eukprot:scaffold6915_cov170-Amphora_coffeaeformis.AAC.3